MKISFFTNIAKKLTKTVAGLSVGLMVLSVFPVSALAAPVITRDFTATITPTASDTSALQNYTLTVTNDDASQNIIRSAGVTIPSGWTVGSLAASSGWTATDLGGQIELQKDGPGSGLQHGESVTLTFSGTAPSTVPGSPSEWTTVAFQGDHQNLHSFNITSAQPTVTVSAPIYVTTQAADSVGETDATLHGQNGTSAASGHSFWVSTSPFVTTSTTLPSGVYSTHDLGPVGVGEAFDAQVSSLTSVAYPSAMPAVTSNTTYYFAAWSNVGGTWYPGDVLNFATLAHVSAVSLPVHVSPADNSVRSTAAQTEIDWTASTDTNSLPVTYTYEVSNDSATNPDGSFATPIYTQSGLTSPSIQTPNTPDGVYYWHVNATDGTDSSGWTTPWKITIDNSPADCVSGSSFDDGFTDGSVNGQNAWSATGPYDQAIVPNNYGYPTFGCKTLRVSDSVTSGSFGDWIFAAPMTNSVGEASSTAGTFSVGTLQNHFEAQFDIASTQATEQPGLHVSVSPDRGDGSRMSYLRFEDQANGIHVFFDDTPSPYAGFVESDIATLDRTAPHTVKLTLDAIDGAGNDVVKVYIDGTLKETGTSWENYYRNDPEASTEQSPRIIKTLIIQARGDATPADAGKGFLFDNLTLNSSEVSGPTGTIQINAYACSADTTVTRSANGVGQTVPGTCSAETGATFGYVHGTQTDANSPYPELGQPFTPGGATGGSGVLNMSDLSSSGRYLVAETNGSGQQLAAGDILGLYCTGDSDMSNNNDNQELTFVPNGDTVHCVAYDKASVGTTTATSTGSLTVNTVITGGPATTSDFSLFVDGNAITEGATTTLDEGSHVVTETNVPDNYTASFGDDCEGGNVTVSSTTPATCTITNTYTPVPTTATINIHKSTTPAGFNQDFTFDLFDSASTSTDPVATTSANAALNSGNTSIENVLPGSYNLLEEDAPLWSFSSASCTYEGGSTGSDAPDGAHGESLTLAAGDVVDCTFNNLATGGAIHITKKVLASDGSTPEMADNTSFTVRVSDGSEADSISETNDVTHSNVLPGTYTVSEDENANYDLVSITPDNNNESEGAQITVVNGTTTEVSIINKQHASSTGSIEVMKTVFDTNNAFATDTHPFTITLNGTSTKTIAEGTNAFYNNLLPGTYTIEEAPDAGYDLFTVSPVDQDGSATGTQVTVTAGTTTVLTLTNKQHAPASTGGTGGTSGGFSAGPTAFSTSGGTQGSGSSNLTGGSTNAPGSVLGVSTFQFLINLYYGMRNNDVLELQKRLAAEGFFHVDPTGYFGPITLQAVKLYQATHMIKPVAGFVGPITRGVLNQ